MAGHLVFGIMMFTDSLERNKPPRQQLGTKNLGWRGRIGSMELILDLDHWEMPLALPRWPCRGLCPAWRLSNKARVVEQCKIRWISLFNPTVLVNFHVQRMADGHKSNRCMCIYIYIYMLNINVYVRFITGGFTSSKNHQATLAAGGSQKEIIKIITWKYTPVEINPTHILTLD